MTDQTEKVTLPAHVIMQDAKSSHHSRFGYDPAAQHLYIDFAKGDQPPKIYRYSNVTPEFAAQYSEAESRGKFFLARIKNETEAFPFVKVSNEP